MRCVVDCALRIAHGTLHCTLHIAHCTLVFFLGYPGIRPPEVRKDYCLEGADYDDGKRLNLSLLRAPCVGLDASVFLQAPDSEAELCYD